MTISDNQLRDVLHRATEHLSGPPGLLDEVRRGGRRRLARRRVVLAAVFAAVVAVPLGAAFQLSSGGRTNEVASPLLDGPTRGDLAGDEAYLRQVREAWQRHLRRGEETRLRGEPHIVWAGSTPAGPAAYLAQETETNPVVSSAGPDRVVAVAAFVEPTADGPRIKTVEMVTEAGPDSNSQATFLGPRRDVLLVLDTGRPVEFSPEMRYAPDGKIDRTYQRVTFEDGAAVLSVPPQQTKITVALSTTPVSQENVVHIDGAQKVLFADGDSPPEPQRLSRTLPGAEEAWGGDPSDPDYGTDRPGHEVGAGPEALAAYIDPAGVHTHDGSPRLSIYGATPDGRRLLLETLQYDDDPARVIALLARDNAPFQAVASAFADWGTPLPIRLRLPDNQGVLVAAEGAALSYRSGAGPWHDAGRNAALVPASTTEVRVTTASETATVPVTS
ncbi:hypothetical protein C1I95_18745 [Micromonospora craterilacus]|uniref:Uncharacterized protein n=1 Tax=Micromonospora craterilacus TaxID=1655439 RepID=A0A2W2FLC0_9ACTN|nr:hypothetical protein [Micromonospora craterilacus]PZG15864.1 hypothetical protein C1I95_18745 [Micromonospora craterilacus]